MAYIDDRIAELEQRIAEKRAYQRLYPSHKYASTWDYVAEGDRSGFDKMDASEAAYLNMLAQQEQQFDILKSQQDFNAKENELNRQNAIKLATLSNSTNSNVANEIANKYELANTDYELALQTFNPDDPSSVANLKRKAQMLNHYGSQLGIDPVSLDAPTSRPKTGVEEQKDYEGVARELLKKTDWTDEDRNKATELKDKVKDETIKQQLTTIISNKGKTKEDKDRELTAAIDSFKKTGKNPDTKKYKVKFKDNKPYTLVRR